MSGATRRTIKTFFGCNTPGGFKGFLQDLYPPSWQVLLIKGSPGSGKNTLMKKVLTAMLLEGEPCEEIACSSDPSSLDGVLAYGRQRAIFDATAPHVMEPSCWGAVETVLDLSCGLNTALLREQAEQVLSLTEACAAQHQECRGFLAKAAFLQNSSSRVAEKKTDFDRILQEADRLFKELFPEGSGRLQERKRFLSAVTPEGSVFFGESLDICDKVVSLYDPYGAFSSVFLSVIRDRALKAGETFYTCFCPLVPDRIEHLIFPKRSLGFTVLNDYHRYASFLRADYSYADFLQGEPFFPEQSCRPFLDDAVKCLQKAKAIHDRLEAVYASAMDWDAADKAAERAVAFFKAK